METATEISLTNAYDSSEPACERHPGWPLHIATECDRLKGVRAYTEHIACSVCGLAWGRTVVSEHERCADMKSNGAIAYAHPVITYQLLRGGPIEIRFES